MIPRLSQGPASLPLYAQFLSELRLRGFSGDLVSDHAGRNALATDNSIYQLTPQAIAFPRNVDDVARIGRVAQEARFRSLKLAPRGGGTGTNGQSLTDGLVVDLSRHMNRILEINVAERWARVEPGVVKDQLNAALAPHGLFFAPELSTSDRATIGGMISTDASGQGSCLYGKTRDHVQELSSVLVDGTLWRSAPLDDDQLARVTARPDRIGAVHRLVAEIADEQAALIERQFPKLNRCLTGYDLAHIRRPDGRFDLNSVLCGSEGTLGFIVEAKLNLLPVPRHSALVIVSYASFDAALRDAGLLMGLGAASVETLDGTLLALARHDPIWHEVRDFFPGPDGPPVAGVNVLELLAQSRADIESALDRVTAALAAAAGGRLDHTQTCKPDAIAAIWQMRKKAVGLLGAMSGERRPVAFIEDTAVPPPDLADYVAELRETLDRRGLTYGMFGHVDSGVLHVRPALDLKDPAHESLVREITEDVVRLTRKYGGLLWGEHGKGLRSEFAPAFFGPLYPALQAIKAAFDPHNQLNPGKIATPAAGRLLEVDDVPLKGALDRRIAPAARQHFADALHCNGNAACQSWDPDMAMCPSWKGTRDRRHSPRGRAQLIREWLHQLAGSGCDPAAESTRLQLLSTWRALPTRVRNTLARSREPDFSHEVKAAMDGCLSCKSCAGQCPVKVDIPTMRARFLELYHSRYLRPVRDHALCAIESLAPHLARSPRLTNALFGTAPVRAALGRIGLAHIPPLSRSNLALELRRRGVRLATPVALRALSASQHANSVVIVQDAFTSFYETPLLLDLIDLARSLDFEVWLAPYRPNGKALQVLGFLARFQQVARDNAGMLRDLAECGVALVGLDPAMTLAYRSEYAVALPEGDLPPVLLVQEWLAQEKARLPRIGDGRSYRLLPHCTQRTTAGSATRDWLAVFDAFGLKLSLLPSGCCGMAGTWGHLTENRPVAETIYRLSWERHVATNPETLLADGFSCRSQVRLLDDVSLAHPLQVLLRTVREARDAGHAICP